LVVTAAFSLVASWNVFVLRAATQEAELMRQGYLPLALALRDTVLAQGTWSSQLNHVTTAKNPADTRLWFDSYLATGRPHSFAAVRSALSTTFGGQGRALAAVGQMLAGEASEIEVFLDGDRELIARLFKALQLRNAPLAQSLRDDLVRRALEGSQRLGALEDEVTSKVDALLDEARSRERLAVRLLLISAGFTVLVGLLVAWHARRLLAPLARVTERAKAVSGGDLTPRTVVPSDDEIGELAATFESMVQAIARANRELLSSERLAAIGKMAAQVTHEVRNPLSSLALNVELLDEELGAVDAEVASLLTAVKLEVERLTQLTEKYLSLARRSRPDFQQEDLGEVVGDALAAVKVELDQLSIVSRLEVADDLPKAWLDELQVRQVMLNLIRNARDAMVDGGELIVGVHARSPASLEISVSDSGSGMDDETRQHLFEPFFTTKGNGTGLGLAVTQEIVEAHGGKIRCQRREPTGTRFVVELPLLPPGLATGSSVSGAA
jgi:signal transduction histidine kinase